MHPMDSWHGRQGIGHGSLNSDRLPPGNRLDDCGVCEILPSVSEEGVRAVQVACPAHGGARRCPSRYGRHGGREIGDRIVACHLPTGHPGEHEEADTEVTWVDDAQPLKRSDLAAAIDLLEDEERFVTWYRLNFDRLNDIDDDMTYAATIRHYLSDVTTGHERLAPEERPCGACGSVGPCRCDVEADEIATGGY